LLCGNCFPASLSDTATSTTTSKSIPPYVILFNHRVCSLRAQHSSLSMVPWMMGNNRRTCAGFKCFVLRTFSCPCAPFCDNGFLLQNILLHPLRKNQSSSPKRNCSRRRRLISLPKWQFAGQDHNKLLDSPLRQHHLTVVIFSTNPYQLE